MSTLATMQNEIEVISVGVAGKYETVEDLIRYAASEFRTVGVDFPPARMSKLIRREVRNHGTARAAAVIDRYLDHELVSWADFELYTARGYADPTGAHAVNNIENARRKAQRQEKA